MVKRRSGRAALITQQEAQSVGNVRPVPAIEQTTGRKEPTGEQDFIQLPRTKRGCLVPFLLLVAIPNQTPDALVWYSVTPQSPILACTSARSISHQDTSRALQQHDKAHLEVGHSRQPPERRCLRHGGCCKIDSPVLPILPIYRATLRLCCVHAPEISPSQSYPSTNIDPSQCG